MAVVSNTSPVRYLVLLGQSELIGRLFGAVLIPQAVEQELLNPRAPLPVRPWMEQRPAWLKVQRIAGPPDEELRQWLDPGEAEAIQLALQLQAEVIILDERRGREVAAAKGLTVTGFSESFERHIVKDGSITPWNYFNGCVPKGFASRDRSRAALRNKSG